MNWDWEKLRENKEQYEKQHESGGGGMPPRPPQMDELFEKMKNFRKSGIFLAVVVLLAIVLCSSCVFTVKTDEVGVIQRFGQYVRTVEPGLNFKMPTGFENVTKVKIRRVYQEEFGLEIGTGMSNYRDNDGGISQAQLMLTGDLNVAVVPWVVQYRISDPYSYLFKIKDVKGFLNNMSEATMRTILGDRSINEAISSREEIAIAAREILQKEMDEAQAGITITLIELKKTNVPAPVQPSFNEVNQAIQEKEQTIYRAKEEYNNEIPQARGEARRRIQKAEGYTIDRINRAQGDASKYSAILKEYTKAKEVTKTRLYLEAMLEIYPEIGSKYIIDSEQKGILPFLNMTGESPVTTNR